MSIIKIMLPADIFLTGASIEKKATLILKIPSGFTEVFI